MNEKLNFEGFLLLVSISFLFTLVSHNFICPSNMSVIGQTIFISAKWTEWNSGYYVFTFVCLSVCLCAHGCSVPNTIHSKLRTSKLTSTSTGTVRTWYLGKFSKGGMAMVTWPLNFWALNANCSKTVKDTDLEFDNLVCRDSPDMTPRKNFEKGAWPGSRDPAAANSLGGYMHSLSAF